MISLALALTLAPMDLACVEPLTLTTGLVLEAKYEPSSDRFCLSVEDFAPLKVDLEGAVQAIERERSVCKARVKRAQDDAEASVKQLRADHAALQESFKTQALALDEARFNMRLWRASAVGVLVLGSVALIVIATR